MEKKPFYKRVWFWIIVVVVIGVIGGTGESSNTGKSVNESDSEGAVAAGEQDVTEPAADDTATDVAEQAQKTEQTYSDVTIESQVLADQDGIKVTATEITNGLLGPEIKIQIENNSTETVMVQSRDVSVNDVMMSNVMFSSTVAASKVANETLSFSRRELETAEIKTIGEIELKIYVCRDSDWSEVFRTDTQQIQTSAHGTFEQTYDDSGFVAVDQDGYRVIVKKLEDQDSFWGADIYVYVENNTDTDMTIQVRDVSINGFMVDPMFSCEVLAGKKAFDSITFLQSDLEDNNITDITDLELYFTVINTKSFETILDTDIVKVSFK